jgi:type IV secretory pathway component VirB8
MTFVLACCLTALLALIAALSQMFPLERTQVFFLESRPQADQIISIEKFDVTPQNIGAYKENFIREYVAARNRIIPSNADMRLKWRADSSGLVFAYSSLDVYSEFIKTDMWHAIMVGKYEPLTFRCDVLFDKIAPRQLGSQPEKYAVKFRYVCGDERDKSTGQTLSKDFTIAVSLEFQNRLKWDERLDNPLGLKIVGYEVEDGGDDPLNPRGWLWE